MRFWKFSIFVGQCLLVVTVLFEIVAITTAVFNVGWHAAHEQSFQDGYGRGYMDCLTYGARGTGDEPPTDEAVEALENFLPSGHPHHKGEGTWMDVPGGWLFTPIGTYYVIKTQPQMKVTSHTGPFK